MCIRKLLLGFSSFKKDIKMLVKVVSNNIHQGLANCGRELNAALKAKICGPRGTFKSKKTF